MSVSLLYSINRNGRKKTGDGILIHTYRNLSPTMMIEALRHPSSIAAGAARLHPQKVHAPRRRGTLDVARCRCTSWSICHDGGSPWRVRRGRAPRETGCYSPGLTLSWIWARRMRCDGGSGGGEVNNWGGVDEAWRRPDPAAPMTSAAISGLD